MGSQGAVGCPSQGCSVVAEVARWVHLVLEGDREAFGQLCPGDAGGIQQSSSLLTSRMKNLAVFTLAQVFFSLETGLMFMPAGRGMAELGQGRAGRALLGCIVLLLHSSSGKPPAG